MSGIVYQNTPSGRSAALAAAGGDASRLWYTQLIISISGS